jgi:hypothetical protein
MIELIGENAKRQSLGFRFGLVRSVAIHERARKIGHLRNPSAVILSFKLHDEIHGWDDTPFSAICLTSCR